MTIAELTLRRGAVTSQLDGTTASPSTPSPVRADLSVAHPQLTDPTRRSSGYKEHPHDVSVMTYRGHAVLRTLIRCHFSPIATTDQRYVYSGSSDGRIHVSFAPRPRLRLGAR